MIGMRAPELVTVCEKSPVRSSAVGMVKRLVAIDLLRMESSEEKKNSLVRLLLELGPGRIGGPPNGPPGLLDRWRGLAVPWAFLKTTLSLTCSARHV